MKLTHNQVIRIFTATLIGTFVWASTHTAQAAPKNEKVILAAQMHEIKAGETLGQIAQAYSVSLTDLMTANDIDNPDKIFFGQKLLLPGDPKHGILTKRGVKLKVPKGFTLNRIAALYEISPKDIIRANRLRNPDLLHEGAELLIPGAKRIVELVPPPPCYKNPVTLYRVRTDETLEMPLEFCSGKANTNGIKQLSELTRYVSKNIDMDLHPRLLNLLQRVADHYPGKRIEIISGQRPKATDGHESYHAKGRALDFRVQGVSNRSLSNYVRTFDKVGVGYYPNSVFIHMDTRDKSAYWIDYSSPGEKAIYGRKGMTKKEIEEIREQRRAKNAARPPGILSAENERDKSSTAKSGASAKGPAS